MTSQTNGVSAWEEAYLRFETPEQEIRKFRTRLIELRALQWPRDARIVELCCGRGNGLRALHSLGFTDVEGVDLSPALAERYAGPGKILVADIRRLPFDDGTKDILIVQGGLHHLIELPEDLDRALSEAARVLTPSGRLVVVEPWLTPFLHLAHAICGIRIARALSPKIDLLATMIDHERITYEQWLAQPAMIEASLRRHFDVEYEKVGWGKFKWVGRRP